MEREEERVVSRILKGVSDLDLVERIVGISNMEGHKSAEIWELLMAYIAEYDSRVAKGVVFATKITWGKCDEEEGLIEVYEDSSYVRPFRGLIIDGTPTWCKYCTFNQTACF